VRGMWELGLFRSGEIVKVYKTGKGMPLELELT
jgi:hypothetical protein